MPRLPHDGNTHLHVYTKLQHIGGVKKVSTTALNPGKAECVPAEFRGKGIGLKHCRYADCPTGCRDTSNETGWSNRLMFRPEGAAVSYTYFIGKVRDCGDDLSWDARFIPGQYHEVRVYMKVNSPGRSCTV